MSKSKSSEMPEPQTLNYNQYYCVTTLFINDLKKVLADVAYIDAVKYFDRINEHKGVMCIADLNEFIRSLGNLPYKVVVNLMNVINNKDNFNKYFKQITPSEAYGIDNDSLGIPKDKIHVVDNGKKSAN